MKGGLSDSLGKELKKASDVDLRKCVCGVLSMQQRQAVHFTHLVLSYLNKLTP